MKYTSVILSLFFLLASCNNNQDSTKNETGEHDHTEESSTSATLTEEQARAINLQMGAIEHKELTATIKANGMLRVPNNNKGNATALYGGVVKTLNVEIGNNVKKGQSIATIENPQFIQLQEEYLTVENRIILAEQEMQRQTELNEGNAGAKKNLQSATAELNTLRTRKASLSQQLTLMNIDPVSVSNSNLRRALTITSPISGTVSNVFAKIGSYVDASTPVAEIVDNNSLHLDLQVFEKDLPKMKTGQIIHFTLTNNPTDEYDAKIYSIGSSFENESKTVAVHCDVIGNKAGLIDGMNITGIVSLDNSTTPAVPNDAIVEADGKYYVFIRSGKPAAPHQHEGEKNGGNEHHHHPQEEISAGETMTFEKIEIVKGVSDMGYTAVTFVKDVSPQTKIVTKGAFFINAKLSNTSDHSH